MEYIPQIEHRWAHLRDQLQNLQSSPKQSEIENTTDSFPELKTPSVPKDERTTETSSHSNKYQEEKRKHEFELATLSERVLQLRCLLDFIQTEPDLQKILGLRAQIEAGSLKMIRFPDIWLLFRPGDLVISKDSDHWQLHKVYATTGGQKQRTSRLEQGNHAPGAAPRPGKIARAGATVTVEEDETERAFRQANFGIGTWTPLKVDCYTFDFIGDELRPIDGLLKIKPFRGEMRITDLSLYPVRFHRDSAMVLKRMEERGLKFLMSPGHKSYTGPSVRLWPMERAREIDGDVYVESASRGVAESVDESSLRISQAERTESEERVGNSLRLLTGNEVDTRWSDEFMSENRFQLDIITVEEAKQSADYLRLLPWVVRAYVFRLRQWGKSGEAEILQCW